MTIRGGGVRRKKRKRRGGALIGADSRTWTPKYLKQGGAWGPSTRRRPLMGVARRVARAFGKRGSGMGFSGAGMSFRGGGLRNGRLFLRRGTGRRLI